VTRYEVRRGYRLVQATAKLPRFETFCSHCLIAAVTEAVFDIAADLRVYSRRHGHPAGDADLLIAATTHDGNRSLATGNIAHYAWMPNLTLVDRRRA